MSFNVGFIGPGIMGRPMALNLMKGGHKLWAYARRPEALQQLTAAGATACATPGEVAAHADVIFTIVSDTPDVETVVFGEQGIIHSARPGLVVVDMSTISPTATKAFAERLSAKGIEMLDAPVSGGETGAINATLSIMAGGKPEVFERVRPLFECMGENIVHVGGNGAGQVAKACNQIVVAVTIEAVAEALTFARKNGADPAKVREALLGGFAGSKILEVHGKRMLDHDFRPGFKVGLHQKDMRIVMETAHQLGLVLPAAALVTQHLNALMGSGDADLDSSAVVKVLERMSGMGGD
ncbi:2-hydroxy-3-oxopropionate reductase [Sulfuricella sp.]|uniref:2-hydroxy-3-oxopropionate reductase n=1 Tax=Sulfuricella sp. TaxID=2099377 RepID=UPI002CBCED90|nr:2-hydroxy-3-oxopropionate reductase [Sulfuricella sp.]HUX64261.1 2-hydroxy-3-oxopropionate reductase [Sulfuricella sp.]